MRLEDMTVVARPRSLGEVHDLAVLILRRHLGPVLLLGLVGIAPWAALDWWIAGLAGKPQGGCWMLAVLAAAQAPLALAPVTAYLGQAMFTRTPRLGEALRTALAVSPRLLLMGLWRGFCAVTVILFPWAGGSVSEVVCLERQGLAASWKRAHALVRVARDRELLHLLAGAATLVLAVWVLTGTVQALGGILRYGALWAESDFTDWLPGQALLPTIGFWLGMLYLAVVRFCGYIDLRTRHEGWDLELDLRRAAARLPGAG